MRQTALLASMASSTIEFPSVPHSVAPSSEIHQGTCRRHSTAIHTVWAELSCVKSSIAKPATASKQNEIMQSTCGSSAKKVANCIAVKVEKHQSATYSERHRHRYSPLPYGQTTCELLQGSTFKACASRTLKSTCTFLCADTVTRASRWPQRRACKFETLHPLWGVSRHQCGHIWCKACKWGHHKMELLQASIRKHPQGTESCRH